MNVLLIGLNPRIIRSFENSSLDVHVYVIEEEELWKNTKMESAILKGVRFGAYQQSLECADVAEKWSKEVPFHAVMPGREYSVFATNETAKRLGLRRLGDLAAEAFSHKYKLRKYLLNTEIYQPIFSRIETEQDVYAFYNQIKEPFILKPSNRQSSVGVVKVENESQIPEKWKKVISASEGNNVVSNRKMHWEYQAESLVEGYEVSVETFVRDGQSVFHNVTKKITNPGEYFVELGHIVPGDIPVHTWQLLIKSQDQLITSLNVENGLLHSEWIISDGKPYLIECAGRAPGGSISELFQLSYEVSMFDLYIAVLAGIEIDFPQKAKNISMLTHFTPKPGKLLGIHGIETLKTIDEFVEIQLIVKPGDMIKPFIDNWARMGYMIFKADDYNKLFLAAEKAKNMVKFQIEKIN